MRRVGKAVRVRKSMGGEPPYLTQDEGVLSTQAATQPGVEIQEGSMSAL